MTQTVLDYLTKPEPELNYYQNLDWQTPTYNSDWNPIENIEEWTDFNYENIVKRYYADLHQPVNPDDLFNPTKMWERIGMNNVYSERGLEHKILLKNILVVSSVLPEHLFIGNGANTAEEFDIFPDWGTGDKRRLNRQDRFKAILGGDTKYNWSHCEAISIIQSSPNGYEYHPRKHIVRPFEQNQHYARKLGICYQFSGKEDAFLFQRFWLSPEPVRTSPRPQRKTRFQGHHQRVISSSTVSDVGSSIGAMSVGEPDLLPDIAGLHCAEVPSTGRPDGLTPNLALYALIRMAAEDSQLRSEYPPMDAR
ncbi:hypothetical protein BDV25DRAFT_138570 [Aspergillus avenaceus]|uniref:Uncharacterized protein n=1 Tax=Aspergillus avenaceus TaxID=36643 RepID=A0A5N6TZI3_ASPAV|nr:hypothetical protein BDV25DRAFT_138570 [Aspergillus avenaceus]